MDRVESLVVLPPPYVADEPVVSVENLAPAEVEGCVERVDSEVHLLHACLRRIRDDWAILDAVRQAAGADIVVVVVFENGRDVLGLDEEAEAFVGKRAIADRRSERRSVGVLVEGVVADELVSVAKVD